MKTPQNKPRPVLATLRVYDIKNDKVVRHHKIDNIKACGKWLASLGTWAISQGYGIQIVPGHEEPDESQEEENGS